MSARLDDMKSNSMTSEGDPVISGAALTLHLARTSGTRDYRWFSRVHL